MIDIPSEIEEKANNVGLAFGSNLAESQKLKKAYLQCYLDMVSQRDAGRAETIEEVLEIIHSVLMGDEINEVAAILEKVKSLKEKV